MLTVPQAKGSDGQTKHDASARTLVDINGDPLSFSGSLTVSWDGTAISASSFEEVQVSFKNIGGGDSYVIQGSIDGTDYTTLTGVNMADNTTLGSIAADGLYSFPACGYVRYVKTGTSSTPTVNLLRK